MFSAPAVMTYETETSMMPLLSSLLYAPSYTPAVCLDAWMSHRYMCAFLYVRARTRTSLRQSREV